MKLCIECKHWRQVNRCAAPNAVKRNPVTGTLDDGFCQYLRACTPEAGGCGPEAKWFEPLPPVESARQAA